jgi:hypothetical protein
MSHMNETAIPDSSAIADAMLKRTGELLREHDAANVGKPGAFTPFRLAAYFANEAPAGAKPRYAQVAEEFHHFPDVFPLFFGSLNSRLDAGPARLTPERISELWNGMPGGHAGFLKQWGYMQFARAIEAELRATLLADSLLTVNDEPAVANQRSGLTPESLAGEMLDAAIYYSNGHETDFRARAQDILDREGTPT